MAVILDLPEYRTLAGLTTTDAARDNALQMLLNEVNDALTRALRQPLESATYTRVLDGPATDRLILPYWPVSPTGLTVLRNYEAKGDPAAFDAVDDLLTRYTDYDLVVDQSDGTSRCGVLVNLTGIWGRPSWRRPPGWLSSQIVVTRGCLKVTWSGGYDQIPASLKSAALLMTSQLFHRRKLGVLPGSASLNGASYSLQGPATAVGMIGDPVISEMLVPFLDLHV